EAVEIAAAEVAPARKRVQEAWLAVVTGLQTGVERVAEQGVEEQAAARSLVAVLVVLGAVVSIAVGLVSARGVTGPGAQGGRIAEQIATGDFTAEIRPDRRDEAGKLLAGASGDGPVVRRRAVGALAKERGDPRPVSG